MKIRKKYELPVWARLPDIRFDIDKLKSEVLRLQDLWVDVVKANEGIFHLHKRLAKQTYSFDQIPLTWHAPNSTGKKASSFQKEDFAKMSLPKESSAKLHRLKTKDRGQLAPVLNEHNWFHPLPHYKGFYIEKALKSLFKSRPLRVRLTRIKKGCDVAPHIDYGPDYAIRVIVPIQGDRGCVNLIKRRGQTIRFHLKADGSAYFLNVGLLHSVEHRGPEDRISLMFSLPDQRDIAGI